VKLIQLSFLSTHSETVSHFVLAIQIFIRQACRELAAGRAVLLFVVSLARRTSFHCLRLRVIAEIRDAARRSKRFAMSTFDYSNLPASDAIDLKKIAKQLRNLVPRATLLIIEIGNHLKEAKARLDHGKFGLFCLCEAGIEIRTAENYLALAEMAKMYPVSEIAKLPARTAYQLAARDAPAGLVKEIMSEVSDNQVPGFDEVRQRIAATKGYPASTSHLDGNDLADRLLGTLDAHEVGNIERFLRTATKSMIAAFCDRLQRGLDAEPAYTDLPKNLL
jgi:hypothetical protein